MAKTKKACYINRLFNNVYVEYYIRSSANAKNVTLKGKTIEQ